MSDPKDTGKNERDEPVSLAPLDPEEALKALLAVKPEIIPWRMTTRNRGYKMRSTLRST